MRHLLGALLVLALAASACGKKDEKTAKLAALCVDTSKSLEERSGSVDTDTFMQMLQNALTACSGACDGKHDASCQKLDAHLTKLCGVSEGISSSLCDAAKGPSLKKYACAKAKK